MIMKSFAALAVLVSASTVYGRTFTVKNNCAVKIWPAIFTDPNVGTATPDQPTGWEAKPGTVVSFSVPNSWAGGRIWGRTQCTSGANATCQTGGCTGGLLCTGPGAGPATLAEFALGAPGGSDYYDVSLVNGFNLPLAIVPAFSACRTMACGVNLVPNCPAALAVPGGCRSACGADLDGTPANSRNCCTGAYDTPTTCPASRVQYYSYFKNACPDAYAFPYDESSSVIMNCPSSAVSDYMIMFCP